MIKWIDVIVGTVVMIWMLVVIGFAIGHEWKCDKPNCPECEECGECPTCPTCPACPAYPGCPPCQPYNCPDVSCPEIPECPDVKCPEIPDCICPAECPSPCVKDNVSGSYHMFGVGLVESNPPIELGLGAINISSNGDCGVMHQCTINGCSTFLLKRTKDVVR